MLCNFVTLKHNYFDHQLLAITESADSSLTSLVMLGQCPLNASQHHGSPKECHLHTLAMRYNNRSALHLQLANYEQAIAYLCKALKLAEHVSRSQIDEPTSCVRVHCTCQHCKLQTCMMNGVQRQPCSRDYSFESGSSSSSDSPKWDAADNTQREGFLYTRPLVVSAISIQKKHDLGVTLSLILLFNLALAYQLDGTLTKSRKLYELCHRIQLEAHQPCCLWFAMCVSNNLSEIHRREKSAQYPACLQHLLSTMMYMVDSRLSKSHNDSFGRVPDSLLRSSNPDFHHYMMQTAMDGFLRNSTKLILNTRVATAA